MIFPRAEELVLGLMLRNNIVAYHRHRKPARVTRPDFLNRFTKHGQAAKPFMSYLTKACGLTF